MRTLLTPTRSSIQRRTLLTGAAAALVVPRGATALPRGAASAVPMLAPNLVTSATLQLWLKADAGCLNGSGGACANGDGVATWQDQSGNANHATQATSGARPTFAASGFNGLPAVAFGGSAVLNNAYEGAPATVVVVFQQTDNAAGRGLFGANTSSGGNDGAYYLSASDGAGYTSSFTEVIQGGTYWSAQSQATAGQLQVACYTNDGATAKLFRGLTACQATAKPAGTLNAIAAPVLIGAQYFNGTIASYHKGYICEVAWYGGALSTADRVAVTNYLNAKWGLTAAGNYLGASFQRPVAGTATTAQLLMWQGGDGQNYQPVACNYLSSFAGKTCRDNAIVYDPVSGYYFNIANNGAANGFGDATSTLSVSRSAGPADGWNFVDQYQIDCSAISNGSGVWSPRLLMNLDGTANNPGDGLYHFIVEANLSGTQLFHVTVSPANLASGNGSSWNFVGAIANQPGRALDAWWFFDGSLYVLWLVNAAPGGSYSETIEIWTSTAIDSLYTALKTGDWAGWLASTGETLIEHPCLYKLPSGNWACIFDGSDPDSTWLSQTSSATGYKGGGSWSAPAKLGLGSFANAAEGFALLQGKAY